MTPSGSPEGQTKNSIIVKKQFIIFKCNTIKI